MKKTFLFLLLPVFMIIGSCNRLDEDDVMEIVMSGETEKLPILKQQLVLVDDISIDSMRLIVSDEPMSGHLYTTWTTGGESKQIIVVVDQIHRSKDHKGYIEWLTYWDDAAKAYLMKSVFD